MTDSEIIELYLKRDEGAIRQTQEKYQRYLMKTAMQILGNEQDAEECVNDTYLAAWESIPANRPEHLSLYLAKIVRAKAIDRVRYNTSEKRRSEEFTFSIEELDEVVSPEASPEEALDSSLLRDSTYTQSEMKSMKFLSFRFVSFCFPHLSHCINPDNTFSSEQ